MDIAKRMNEIFANIETARISVDERHIVKIVSMSKYVDADMISSLYNQGQRAFGENKVQDFAKKHKLLEELPIEWHFAGRLQSNKINQLLQLKPSLLQSLDSISLAKALDERLKRNNQTQNVLLQINSSQEESKSGVSTYEAIDVYDEIMQRFDSLNLKGVMCIGAFSDDKKEVQKSFESVRSIYDNLTSKNASICSMGMSADYQLAIMCGSNMVRLGKVFYE